MQTVVSNAAVLVMLPRPGESMEASEGLIYHVLTALDERPRYTCRLRYFCVSVIVESTAY